MKLIEADKVKRVMKDYWKAQVDKALTLTVTDVNEANKRINSYLEHNHELLKAIDELPSAEPYTIHSDGRLWVTVDDIDKVNAVVVDESKSKFCKQFYMDVQPERKDALEKDVAVEAISDELMSRFDISATYAYEVAEAVINRIEAMAKELERGEQE